VKRILLYVSYAASYRLHLQLTPLQSLSSFSAMYWVGSSDMGYAVFHRPNLITCNAHKQATLSHGGTEAEY
jgi:hypothetical protein